MSQQVYVNTDTDMHLTGIPDVPHAELVKKLKIFLSTKSIKAKSITIVKLAPTGEYVLRLATSDAVQVAVDSKVKFVRVDGVKNHFQAVRARSTATYQATNVPAEFQQPVASSSNAPTTSNAPTDPSGPPTSDKPSRPDLSNLHITDNKPERTPGSETSQIAVATQHSKMTRLVLIQIFRTDNGKGSLTRGFSPDVLTAWENEDPPRFQLSAADKIQPAIEKYHGQVCKGFEQYGILDIKVVEPKREIAPAVAADGQEAIDEADEGKHVARPDGKSDLTPAPRPRPKPEEVLTRMGEGALKWPKEVDNALEYTNELKPSGGNGTKVIANYVQVTAWPKQIYEYGINIKDVELEPGAKGEKRTRRIGRLNEKKAIIETLSENWPLAGKRWATDYETLWVLEPLWGHTGTLEILDVGKIHFYKNDGRTDEHAPQVELTYLRTLNLPNANQLQSFVFADGHDFRERIIQALNAFVAKHVGLNGEGAGPANQTRVKQIAPNKFYACKYFNELNEPPRRSTGGNTFGGGGGRGGGGRGRNAGPGSRDRGQGNFRSGGRGQVDSGNDEEAPRNFTRTFLAYRGFSTSIRPTADHLLLGIAPLTSAFFRPVTVQDWIDRLGGPDGGFNNEKDILKTLVGVRCRLVHERVRHNDGDPDPNDERHRYKVITEFGKNVLKPNRQPLQMFQPRPPPGSNVAPPLQTVASCFADLLAVRPDLGNTICVNVGAKLKYKPRFKNDKEQNPIKRIEQPDRYENFEKALWIPAKLLEIEPMQLYSKVLSGTYQVNMINVACKSPQLNRAWIEGPGFEFLGIQGASVPQQISQAPWMRDVQLSIRGTLLRVDATLRDLPMINYGNNLTLDQGTPNYRDASWNLDGVQFLDSAHVPALCFVRLVGKHYGKWYNGKPADRRKTEQLFGLIVKQFGVHGITSPIAEKRFLEWEINIGAVEEESNVTTIIDDEFWAISKAIHQGEEYPTEPKLQQIPNTLFVIILPQKDPANLFQSAKRAADQYGLQNICVTSDKIEGPKYSNEQYVSNLCLKVNAKAAKDVHHLAYFSSSSHMKNTIVLGADIGTVKGGPLGCPSIAAVVGSVDKEHMITPGSMRLIPAKQDTVPFMSMRDMVYERLEAWFNKQGSLPTNILMYRDGISQSQYASLLEKADGTFYDKPAKLVKSFKPYESEHKKKKKRASRDGEVAAIYAAYRLAATKLEPGNPGKPNLTFVVVGKRHNTRFFPQHVRQSITFRDNGNLRPGHIIQSGCTLPNEWPVVDNFFLLSHAAIKGTARPAHYVVLRDEMNLSSQPMGKPLHEITHNFCFAYTRATKGVSYCAPAYHADRLCTRGQDYLKRIMHDLADNNDWWGDKMPEPTKQNPDPAEGWYQTIANEVSRHVWWNQDPQYRGNPWHWSLDDGMFWI